MLLCCKIIRIIKGRILLGPLRLQPIYLAKSSIYSISHAARSIPCPTISKKTIDRQIARDGNNQSNDTPMQIDKTKPARVGRRRQSEKLKRRRKPENEQSTRTTLNKTHYSPSARVDRGLPLPLPLPLPPLLPPLPRLPARVKWLPMAPYVGLAYPLPSEPESRRSTGSGRYRFKSKS